MSVLDNLQYKQDLDWNEVFEVWRKHEAHFPGWVHVATKVKGWDSWEEWRMYMALQMNLPEEAWKLYEIPIPEQQIPNMLVGPFWEWQKQLPEPIRLQATFHDFIAERLEWAKGHHRIPDMMEHFSSPTQFIGLYLEDQDRLLCFEGSHRAAAVALAGKEGVNIDFGSQKPLIAVATISGDTNELLARAMEIGSENPEKKDS